MESNPSFSNVLAITLVGFAFAASSAHAVDYYLDSDGATPGFGTAGGTWAAPTVSLWSNDPTGVVATEASITTTTSDVLNFGTATFGLAAGTITVSDTVSANKLTFGSASDAVTLSGGSLAMGGTTPTITVNNSVNTISSILTGTGTLMKQGVGTLTLKLGAAAVIPDGAFKGNLTVTGTLDLNTFSETINGLSGAGIVDTVAGGTPTLTVGANDQTSTFSGTIQNTAGTLALAKTGTGTLTFSGSNTYAGATTIGAGTLALGANNVLPDSSSLTIGAATLNAATFDESVGTLDISAAATIHLGKGANLVFADSNGVDWTDSPGTPHKQEQEFERLMKQRGPAKPCGPERRQITRVRDPRPPPVLSSLWGLCSL
jgi:autotransporter-associated beta strand protein